MTAAMDRESGGAVRPVRMHAAATPSATPGSSELREIMGLRYWDVDLTRAKQKNETT